MEDVIKDIFTHHTAEKFENTALKIFRYQAHTVPAYREFIQNLRINPDKIRSVNEIPFLPISFFKTHPIITEGRKPETTFTSSGTTGSIQSKHDIASEAVYKQSFEQAFRLFYGDVSKYCILGLLPGYLERTGSSLVYMVDHLIKLSENTHSGFYLHDFEKLHTILNTLKNTGTKTILFGVSFGLLDFIEQYQIDFPELIIMETGGMKGRRKELTRNELHKIICKGFGIGRVHSEYGMTELLSQAYSSGNGRYSCPPWMQIKIRDPYDPFSTMQEGISGGINVIDLANVYSCSFIETQDIGKLHPIGQFEVLGRLDHSDIRGCNLMIS